MQGVPAPEPRAGVMDLTLQVFLSRLTFSREPLSALDLCELQDAAGDPEI